MGGRDNDVVFGENLDGGQGEIDLLVLVSLDGDRLFEVVMVKTHALDSYKILAGRNGGNVDAVLLVGGINLVDDASACMVETVEDHQDGVSVFLGVQIAKLETNSAGIHNFGGSGGGSGLRGGFAIMVVRK